MSTSLRLLGLAATAWESSFLAPPMPMRNSFGSRRSGRSERSTGCPRGFGREYPMRCFSKSSVVVPHHKERKATTGVLLILRGEE